MDKCGIATESAGVLELDETKVKGVFDNVIIQEGWGSSGFYPGDVLKRDGARAFPAGTRIFLDHADGPVEKSDRLIGVTQEAARYVEEDGVPKLRAPMRFFSDKLGWVKERAEAKVIEVSIRSGVTYAQGERAGRFGKVVTAFTEGISVDVVARGGAGGKFGTIQESAQIGQAALENQIGDDVALTAEETAAIANAFVEGLKPQFAAITSALGDLKVASESKGAPLVALTAREINTKIVAAKLGDKGASRVYEAVEAAEIADEAFVDKEIAREASIREEAAAEAKAALGQGNAQFDESGKPGDTDTYKLGTIGSWGVANGS